MLMLKYFLSVAHAALTEQDWKKVLMTAKVVHHLWYLVHLGHHFREERMQDWKFPAKVDVPFKACRVRDCLWVWDFEQEALHIGPFVLQELVHEGHVLFLVTKSDSKEDTQRNLSKEKHYPKIKSVYVCGSQDKHTKKYPHLLGEVRQVLGDFCDERERTSRAVIGILLHQIEKRGRHDGRAEEAKEQGRADQTLTDVWSTPVATFLSPWCKHLFQFSRKDAVEKKV